MIFLFYYIKTVFNLIKLTYHCTRNFVTPFNRSKKQRKVEKKIAAKITNEFEKYTNLLKKNNITGLLKNFKSADSTVLASLWSK